MSGIKRSLDYDLFPPGSKEIVENLLLIKKAADEKTPLISNQGQALDGISELANYRRSIENLQALLEKEEEE